MSAGPAGVERDAPPMTTDRLMVGASRADGDVVSAGPDGLALLAGGLWGTSDFVGGTLSRRLRTLYVLCGSQAISLVLALGLLGVPALGSTNHGSWGWPVVAGVTWALGMGALYTALAVGTMGVVAPIAAGGAAVPVLVGVIAGEQPGPLALTGVIVVLAGIVGAAGPELDAGAAEGRRRGVGLAIAAAVLFGVEIVCLARGSADSVATTLVGMRVTALACTLLALTPLRRPGRHCRRNLRPAVRDVPALLLLALLDVAATLAYALASRAGMVSLVAVLASTYPAVTVLLARRLHGERLRRTQILGVTAVLTGSAAVALSNVS
jgi:drug/metabolite transporter (DMT)-like permease